MEVSKKKQIRSLIEKAEYEQLIPILEEIGGFSFEVAIFKSYESRVAELVSRKGQFSPGKCEKWDNQLMPATRKILKELAIFKP